MTQPLIKLEQVDFQYPIGSTTRRARPSALLGIDLDVPEAIRIAVIGPNGAGKSTLLQLLNGTLKPTKGTLRWNGTPLDYSRRTLAQLRRHVALVFQDPDDQLFAATVRQDISFGPMNLGLTEAEVIARIDEAMATMGVVELADLAPHQLSHGERKRVAIAGALAMKPRVLVLDEPTAGLDPSGVAALAQLLVSLSEQGLSIVLSSHDLEFARGWAQKLIVLNQGCLIAAGEPQSILECPKSMAEVGLPIALGMRLRKSGIQSEAPAQQSWSDRAPHRTAGRVAKARIHELYAQPMDGAAIERESLRRIDAEAPPHALSTEEWQVARRLIHTTADFGLLDELSFSKDAIGRGLAALEAGAPIYVDSNMIASGLSLPRLQRCHPQYSRQSLYVHVADPDVAEAAESSGLPRAVHALRKAAPKLSGAIVCFGNSPVGLLELNRLILEEGLDVALVVAMPVGFVHVRESKQELLSLAVPQITLTGRRGGSPLAVATIHALSELVIGGRQPRIDSVCEPRQAPPGADAKETVILLGHGSRVPDAAAEMTIAAEQLMSRYGHRRVEVCFMSRLGPHLPEMVERCVRTGAARIVVVPYFLHGGLHIRLDIPEMLKDCAAAHPEIRVILADRLGYDDRFVDVIEQRIAAARTRSDVGDLVLPPRAHFPLPVGQDEFVPMSPELAARWRQGIQQAEGGDV